MEEKRSRQRGESQTKGSLSSEDAPEEGNF